MNFKRRLMLSFLFISISLLLIGCLNEDGDEGEKVISDNVSISTISWPTDQQLPRFKEPEELDVLDISNKPGDIKLLFATLQGIVNREKPRIYLLENNAEGKYTWLNDMDIPFTVFQDEMELLDKYSEEITGMIVYDPEVIDTVNVATTMAGINNALVVSPDLAEQLGEEPWNLEIVEDLQGKFTDRLAAYEWQFENLWDQTTNRMLVGLSPGTPIDIPEEDIPEYEIITEDKTQETGANNHDTYTFDLSEYTGEEAIYIRFEDAYPQDGWGPAVHRVKLEIDGKDAVDFKADSSEEKTHLYDDHHTQVAEGRGGHRFADGDSYFIYQFDLPTDAEELNLSVEMWNQFKVSVSVGAPPTDVALDPYGYLRDYAVANKAMVFWLGAHEPEEKVLLDKILEEVQPGTPYLGWFADDVKGEFEGVEYLSRYGVYVVPADWFNNLTVFSGTKMDEAEEASKSTPILENKIYVTLMFGEGDNFQYNQHHMRILWDDINRGKIPLNWTSSPLLYDGAPAILDYYQKTATENDLIMTGPSGVGYFYADAWPTEHIGTFLAETYHYMKKTNMTTPYVLNRVNGQNIPLDDKTASAYEEHYEAPGLFLSWEDKVGVSISNDTLPISTIRGIGSIKEGQEVLEQAKNDWDGEGPAFVSIGLLAWNLSPSDAVMMTRSLGPEYEIVLADDYLSLIRQAYELDE